MPDYLLVADFLAYDGQMAKKVGRVNDAVDAVREQINRLTGAFTAYVAETDTFRIQVRQEFERINYRLDKLEQTMSQNFALLFAHLGISQ